MTFGAQRRSSCLGFRTFQHPKDYDRDNIPIKVVKVLRQNTSITLISSRARLSAASVAALVSAMECSCHGGLKYRVAVLWSQEVYEEWGTGRGAERGD